MNRFKRNGGATPVPIYGYIKPEGAKHYSEWRKDGTVTTHLEAGLRILDVKHNWTAVAEYFNGHSVPTGPYCRDDQWNGAMVKRLYHNPILKGMPQRGARHSVKLNKSGQRVSEVNPNGPTYRNEPHLAHFEGDAAIRLDDILKEVDDQNKKLGRGRSESSERNIGNGKRSRFPGRCAVCWYCGHKMVWGGNGITGNLMCNGARNYRCWNAIGFSGALAAEKITAFIKNELEGLDGAFEQFAELVEEAVSDKSQNQGERQSLEADERKLQTEQENVLQAICQSGPHPLLNQKLAELDERKVVLERRRREFDRQISRQTQAPLSAEELREEFTKATQDLANNSYEFADIMLSMVTDFKVYLVRIIDGGSIVPRAKVTLCLGGFIRNTNQTPEIQEFLTRELTIDLYEEPMHVKIREQAIEKSAEKIKQRDIAAEFDTHQVTVQRAIKLDKLMRQRGLTSPYELVTEPPTEDENRKMKRHRNPRYHYEPVEGYIPSTI